MTLFTYLYDFSHQYGVIVLKNCTIPLVRSFFHQNAQAPYSFLQLVASSILALELSILGSTIYLLLVKLQNYFLDHSLKKFQINKHHI
jgi:hypothetical protein